MKLNRLQEEYKHIQARLGVFKEQLDTRIKKRVQEEQKICENSNVS